MKKPVVKYSTYYPQDISLKNYYTDCETCNACNICDNGGSNTCSWNNK